MYMSLIHDYVITFDKDEIHNFLCVYARAENERNYLNLVPLIVTQKQVCMCLCKCSLKRNQKRNKPNSAIYFSVLLSFKLIVVSFLHAHYIPQYYTKAKLTRVVSAVFFLDRKLGNIFIFLRLPV